MEKTDSFPCEEIEMILRFFIERFDPLSFLLEGFVIAQRLKWSNCCPRGLQLDDESDWISGPTKKLS
jgi:hypothetical protein